MSTTVVVGGALANKWGNGGEAWVRMSWAVGLRRLGFDVFFLEEIEQRHCVDAAGRVTSFERSANLAFFEQVVREFGFVGSAALVYEGGTKVAGAALPELLDRLDSAELLVNISGHVRTASLLRPFRRRAFVDIDPCFTQLWHAEGIVGARLAGHDAFFTIGENIGTKDCSIPTGDIRWIPTRQPVVLADWPADHEPEGRFTTVATWRGPYGPPSHNGATFGLKAHQFRRFADLPTLSTQSFELALAIDPGDASDLAMLLGKGWEITDPLLVARDPADFRRYVQRSKAEFSCAQGVYVETGSGWFSDRTTRYLASGRPAVVQDTGFSRNLPTGEGLLTFRTMDEALEGVEHIGVDYERHRTAARALAEQEFDSDKVLGRFVEAIDVSP